MILHREPVLLQAAFVAALNVVVAFGILDLNPAQTNAFIALVAAALGLVTRRLVTPDPKHGPGAADDRPGP